MKFAVMNDFEKCEIYIQAIEDQDEIDFINSHSTVGTSTVSEIKSTLRDARFAAKRESEKTMWEYNPYRNKLTP